MSVTTEAADIRSDLDYLYSLNGRGIKPGLERVQKLLNELGNPQEHLKIIHVAGTNGKGSTCAIIASLLRSAGLRVGLYTSPHLLRFNERIRIADNEISNREIAEFIRLRRIAIDRLDCSFFEATTAMAFEYFKRHNVDFVVLETGMGGRFDATNVARPVVTVITPVARDHQEFLGRRLAQIAFEKAGIAKSGVPCVIARQAPRLEKILSDEIQKRGGKVFYAKELCQITSARQFPDRQEVNLRIDKYSVRKVRFPLVGSHQLINLQTALAAVALIEELSLNANLLQNGIARVSWPGRLQILQHKPFVFYDVGHNQHGIRQIVRTLVKLFPGRPIHLMLALGSQKKFDRIGRIIRPLNGEIFITEIPGHSSVTAALIAQNIRTVIDPARVHIELNAVNLLNILIGKLRPDEILLIIGSHYLAPAVLPFFQDDLHLKNYI